MYWYQQPVRTSTDPVLSRSHPPKTWPCGYAGFIVTCHLIVTVVTVVTVVMSAQISGTLPSLFGVTLPPNKKDTQKRPAKVLLPNAHWIGSAKKAIRFPFSNMNTANQGFSPQPKPTTEKLVTRNHACSAGRTWADDVLENRRFRGSGDPEKNWGPSPQVPIPPPLWVWVQKVPIHLTHRLLCTYLQVLVLAVFLHLPLLCFAGEGRPQSPSVGGLSPTCPILRVISSPPWGPAKFPQAPPSPPKHPLYN